MKIKSLLVKQYTDKGLMLNESVSKTGKFILEGPFGVVSDSPNNNGRIYTKEEYLPHIKALRDEIKSGTPILGEIDHPEDRFEVKLKEASHRVVDLWFDSAKNMVMGKIELLNTPNGKILQSLVEQHIPIFISSRAAGTVGPDNKVNIKRIFTWDAVYKPGFKECKLELVNESYRGPVSEFLNKTVETKKNIANEFNILNENIEIYEMNKMPNLKFKKELSQKDLEALTKPISESDEKDKKIKEDAETFVDISDMQTENDSALTPAGNDMPQVSNEDLAAKLGLPSEAQDASERIEKDKSKDELFLDIEGEYSKDEDKEDSDDEDSDDESKETESGDADGFILDIEAEGDAEDDESDDEEESKEDKEDDSEEAEETEDKEEKEEEPKKSKKVEKDEKDLEENLAKKTTNVNVNKYKKLIDKYKTNEAKKEEFISKYPKFENLSALNKEYFMTTLSESEREAFHDAAVQNMVDESEGFINKYYNLAYGEYMADKAMPTEEKWLKYAPSKYKKVYESLNVQGKKKINELAECFVLNNQRDVNSFWESTGLLSRVQRTEEKNLAYDATNESEQSIYEEEPMYDINVFKTFESKMQDLNNGEYDLV